MVERVKRLWLHVRTLWPGPSLLLLLPWVLWPLVQLALGGFRAEHLALMVGFPLLACWSSRTKRLFLGAFPIGLVALVYDGMRYVKDVGLSAARIHLCDLRALDMKIARTSLGSVHDWFQVHNSPFLDVLCAVPYGTFIPAAFGFAFWLYLKDYPRMVAFTWSFALLNFAGFITYHLLPAAPPWYYHAHGCVVDLSAHASEGPNLARVDALLGIPYFATMYGRSSDVFGALPSLHVAYPTIILLFGWPRFDVRFRVLAVAFVATMCFAAVYLDHHWIVDVLMGLAYTLIVFVAVRAVGGRRRSDGHRGRREAVLASS